MSGTGIKLSRQAASGLRRRMRVSDEPDERDDAPDENSDGDSRKSQRYNDSRFAYMAAFEKLMILLLCCDAACAVYTFMLPNEQPAIAGAISGAEFILLPMLRGIDAVLFYMGYASWAISACEAGLWLRDAIDYYLQRRALAAAKEVDGGSNSKPQLTIPWWHESWLLFGLRAGDAAVVLLYGALLLLFKRRGASQYLAHSIWLQYTTACGIFV